MFISKRTNKLVTISSYILWNKNYIKKLIYIEREKFEELTFLQT